MGALGPWFKKLKEEKPSTCDSFGLSDGFRPFVLTFADPTFDAQFAVHSVRLGKPVIYLCAQSVKRDPAPKAPEWFDGQHTRVSPGFIPQPKTPPRFLVMFGRK